MRRKRSSGPRVRKRWLLTSVAATLAVGASVTSVGLPERLVPRAGATTAPAPVWGQLAGVGSAETDAVMNSLAGKVQMLGESVYTSYSSSGGGNIAPKGSTPCVTARPANDDQGYAALAASATAANSCIDFARMAQPYTGPAVTSPSLAYVPFALDGLTFAVTSSSTLPRNLSLANLKLIYTCDPSAAGVKALLPAEGSEQRQMWLSALGIADADVVAGKYPCITDKTSAGQGLVEDDGRVLDSNSIMPFSIAAFMSESGLTQANRLGTATLGTVTDQAQPPVVANTSAYPSGVTFAVTGQSTVPVRLSVNDLTSIYTCAVTGVTPLLPTAGPERAALEQLVGITDDDISAGTYPCIQTSKNGAAIQPNDGRVLDSASIMPFSISSYLGQMLGSQADQRGSAVLGVLDDTGAASAPPLPMMLNTAYGAPFVHHVYNAVAVASADASPLNETFLGPNSLVCKQTAAIQAFGFAPLAANDAEPCGSLQHQTADTTTAAVRTQTVRSSATTASFSDAPPVSLLSRPIIPLDTGELPGSGQSWSLQHGSCSLVASYYNDPNVRSRHTSVSGYMVGPHCSVVVYAYFFSTDSDTDLPYEVQSQSCTSQCTVTLNHNGAGYYAFHYEGINQIFGDVLVRAYYVLQDTSIPANASSITIEPESDPTVTGLVVTNEHSAVTLTWDTTPNATSYAVLRADASTGYDFRTVAQVPSLFTGQSWRDPGTGDLNYYMYKVVPYYSDGSAGNASFTVSVVPAEPLRVKHYVALGDSYASGVGASPTAPGNGQCLRSPNAYAGLVKDASDSFNLGAYTHAHQGRVDLFACGGAKTGDIVAGTQGGMEGFSASDVFGDPNGDYFGPDKQLNMLFAAQQMMPIDYVTVSIGGNDVGFSPVILSCILGTNGCTTGSTLAAFESRLDGVVNALEPHLREVYDDVALNSGLAHVNVIEYPHIFPANGGATNCALDPAIPISIGNVGLTPERMLMLNRVTDALDAAIAQAASEANGDVNNVSAIDTRPTFQGHDICSAGNAWINRMRLSGVTFGGVQTYSGSAHPNNSGWAALAALISSTNYGSPV